MWFSNLTQIYASCLAKDMAGVKSAWVISSHYKHFFVKMQHGFSAIHKGMIHPTRESCEESLKSIRLDREKVLSMIKG